MINEGFDISPVPLPDEERVPSTKQPGEGEKTKDIDVTIRKATINDVRDILELINSFASQNLMLARGPQYLYENVRDFIVAEPNAAFNNNVNGLDHKPSRIIACASLHLLWEDVAEIRSIAIEPDYQHRGLGKKLIEFLKLDAKRLGVKTLFTFTLADDFFKSLGFVRKERDELHPKVWGECRQCPKFFKCDEVGMIFELS